MQKQEIQKIYDYLYTRSIFNTKDIANTKEIAKECEDPDNYKYLVTNLSKIMQNEDFFISYQDEILDIVGTYRFKYNKDRELCEDINYIISRIYDYRRMDYKRQSYLYNEWLKKEYKDRGLAFTENNKSKVDKNIMDEIRIFSAITKYIAVDKKMGNIQYDEEYTDTNIKGIDYLQIINLLANRFPEYFKDDDSLNNILFDLCISVVMKTKSKDELKYIKKTIKNICKAAEITSTELKKVMARAKNSYYQYI